MICTVANFTGKSHVAITSRRSKEKQILFFSEFHYGPESSSEDSQNDVEPKTAPPPKSAFQKLAPSSNRYTLLRDEL